MGSVAQVRGPAPYISIKVVRSLTDWGGLLTLYIPHTSAPLLIQENASPDVRRDLDAFLPRVPENVAPYRPNDEGPDDMPAHIKRALTQTQLSIPVTDGRFAARHLAGVPIPCVSRADPPGFRIRRAADFSEPPLRYVVVWNVAKETACRTLSHFAGEVVIGTASRLRWDQEFESPLLHQRVMCEPDSSNIVVPTTPFERSTSNSAIDCPSTPAAPWLAFTRLKASQTSLLGMSNGFALPMGSSRRRLVHGLD
jgi:secondary thiamine-phosphate synthase enzyme